MYDYNAVLRRVIDGDTYVLDIDLGFHIWTTQHVRLEGIDCPEKNTPEGVLATNFARVWFSMAGPGITIRTAPGQPTTFERWVAGVFLPAGASALFGCRDLAGALRTAGHVKHVG